MLEKHPAASETWRRLKVIADNQEVGVVAGADHALACEAGRPRGTAVIAESAVLGGTVRQFHSVAGWLILGPKFSGQNKA
jgi:hypothetical protein